MSQSIGLFLKCNSAVYCPFLFWNGLFFAVLSIILKKKSYKIISNCFNYLCDGIKIGIIVFWDPKLVKKVKFLTPKKYLTFISCPEINKLKKHLSLKVLHIIKKIRFKTGKSLFFSDGDCLLYCLTVLCACHRNPTNH